MDYTGTTPDKQYSMYKKKIISKGFRLFSFFGWMISRSDALKFTCGLPWHA